MNNFQDSFIDLEEVEKVLFDIDLKYSPEQKGALSDAKKKEDLEEVLAVLSKEFDCLGLPSLDLDKPESHILQQVAITARSLVQIYRSAVGEIKDKNIENRKKDCKKNELYCRIDESKLLLEKAQEKYGLLQNKVQRLTQEISELKTKESYFQKELEKIKRFYASKQNELQHSLRKVRRDNDQLKEICKQDITTPNTTNEVALKLLKQYRTNEEILKSTIQKLQNNNQELLQELLNLKEEVILLAARGFPM